MNCDQAFEFLTDPTLRHSRELQWHLSLCPRCRDMQETLQPALAVFDSPPEVQTSLENALADPEQVRSSQSPSEERPAVYLTPEAMRVAQKTANHLASSSNPRSRGWQRFSAVLLRHAAVFLLGLMLAYGAFVVSFDEAPSSANLPTPLAETACTWQSPDELPPAEPRTPRSVILSCIDCHLGPSPQ